MYCIPENPADAILTVTEWDNKRNVPVSVLQAKITEWAKGAGVSGDLAAICKDPKTSDFLLKELNTTGKEGKLKVTARTWCMWLASPVHRLHTSGSLLYHLCIIAWLR